MPQELPKIDEVARQKVNEEYEKSTRMFEAYHQLWDKAYKSKLDKDYVIAYLEGAKAIMYGRWGVDNLSTIEGVRLRQIVEHCFQVHKEEARLIEEGKYAGIFKIEVEEEAAARWLYELYSIKSYDLPRVFVLEDEKTGDAWQYEITEEDLFDKKEKELKAAKHEVNAKTFIVPDDFKEHLKSLREKAHSL